MRNATNNVRAEFLGKGFLKLSYVGVIADFDIFVNHFPEGT